MCKNGIFWLCLGLGCIALGLWRAEAGTVLAKGIRVCLECIGIG